MLESRRKYSREYARARREVSLAERNGGSRACHATGHATCQRRNSARTVCGALLETGVDRLGRTVLSCPLCARRARGVCRDCSRPVYGTVGMSLRCVEHAKQAVARSQSRWRGRNRDLENERERVRESLRTGEERERDARKKRAWRLAHPDLVRKQKRRALLREGKSRERYLKYHRRYNRQKRRLLRKRAMAKLDYYRAHPVRPVPTCRGCAGYLDWTSKTGGRAGKPPVWCDGCAPRAEQRRRLRLGRSVSVAPVAPAASLVPPLRAIARLLGEKLCVSPGCTALVPRGRRKRCDGCRSRDRAALLRQEVAA